MKLMVACVTAVQEVGKGGARSMRHKLLGGRREGTGAPVNPSLLPPPSHAW